MLGTELSEGQGLGNQLFCYVTTRCIAMDRGYDFCILGGETLANNIHSTCGLYFMDLDLGVKASQDDFEMTYHEKEQRIYKADSVHDLENGIYVSGTDEALMNVADGTLISGNMQSEDYFRAHLLEIKDWLKVKPEYDCRKYSRENLCILHLRCGDYLDSPELYLRKRYWIDGMKAMKKVRPDMEFMIITDDVRGSRKDPAAGEGIQF
jgi:hypothetical protein